MFLGRASLDPWKGPMAIALYRRRESGFVQTTWQSQEKPGPPVPRPREQVKGNASLGAQILGAVPPCIPWPLPPEAAAPPASRGARSCLHRTSCDLYTGRRHFLGVSILFRCRFISISESFSVPGPEVLHFPSYPPATRSFRLTGVCILETAWKVGVDLYEY